MIRFAGSPSPYFAAARPVTRTAFDQKTDPNPHAAREAITTLIDGLQYVGKPDHQMVGINAITVKDSNNNLYILRTYPNFSRGINIDLMTPRGRDNPTDLIEVGTGSTFNGRLLYKPAENQKYDFTEYPGHPKPNDYADSAFCKEVYDKLAALFPAT